MEKKRNRWDDRVGVFVCACEKGFLLLSEKPPMLYPFPSSQRNEGKRKIFLLLNLFLSPLTMSMSLPLLEILSLLLPVFPFYVGACDSL